jgi:hypothetical protein
MKFSKEACILHKAMKSQVNSKRRYNSEAFRMLRATSEYYKLTGEFSILQLRYLTGLSEKSIEAALNDLSHKKLIEFTATNMIEYTYR